MRVCFTGHRPSKLPGGYAYHCEKNYELGRALRKEILELIKNGANYFICGGALGVDQIAFMVLQKLKKQGYNIQVEIAVPFRYQYIKWSEEQRKLYFQQIQHADKVTYVDELETYSLSLPPMTYNVAKMEMRNRYMVDNADVVIAVWNGSTGGTKNCIDYANKSKKKIVVIDSIFEKESDEI